MNHRLFQELDPKVQVILNTERVRLAEYQKNKKGTESNLETRQKNVLREERIVNLNDSTDDIQPKKKDSNSTDSLLQQRQFKKPQAEAQGLTRPVVQQPRAFQSREQGN